MPTKQANYFFKPSASFEKLDRELRKVKTVDEEDRVLRAHGWTWGEYYQEAQRRDEKEEVDKY